MIDQADVVVGVSGFRVLSTQDFLMYIECFLVIFNGLAVITLVLVIQADVVVGCGSVGMLCPQDFFINIGLNSYDYYCRYAALSTLMFWKQETEKPIYAFPLSILESLLNLKTKEVMKDNKKLLMELLSDLKDLKKDAAKENSNIIKIIDNAIEDEDLDNYEEPKIIFK